MTIQPLRKILSIQSILIAVIPFVFLTAVSLVWFLPKFAANVELQQVQLSKVIASKAESHLIKSKTVLESISAFIQTCENESVFDPVLTSQIGTVRSLKTIYVIGPDGKVDSVALKAENRDQKQDLKQLDLSGNPLFKRVVEKRNPVWSDTFLSVIGGGISVALAIPSGKNIVMGEIDLGALTDYLKQIKSSKEQVIMVLDRRGQVIADHEGNFTAQQFNLGHLSIVKKGLKATQPVVGSFELNGRAMTGCLVKASLIDWSVLIASPEEISHAPVVKTFFILGFVLLFTVCTGMFLAIFQAQKFAVKFEKLAEQTKQITKGEKIETGPVFNITEFKALADDFQTMADSIQEREAYNRILFASSPIPLLVLDPQDSSCIDANEAALRLLGMSSPQSLQGQSLLNFSAAKQSGDIPVRLAAKTQVIDCMEKGFASFEWVFQRADKEVWYGDIALSKFNHNHTLFLQMSIKDITRRKLEEARRKKLEEQLRQAQKMESIGTLAGGIAHDFNNILFPVMGFAEMVIDDLDQDSPFMQPMQEIFKGCTRAKELVEQILTFSRQADMEYKPLQIHLILKEILKLSRSTLPTTISIQQHIDKHAGMVMADPTQIHQVIMNLVTNAFHAMEEQGGVLNVKLNAVQLLSENLPGPDLIPGWYVCLEIGDTGTGIAPELMEKIFDPYFTTKAKGKGTGLGLSVVHGIVKGYQGDILFDSVKGQGTVVKVYLPRFVAETQPPKEPQAPSDLTGKGHVLLVDDERPICLMIEQMLERLGYSVTSMTDSMDALTVFTTDPDQFDLVITDMTMPDLTGDKLAQEIRTMRPKIPIIMCTGFSEKVNKGDTDDIQVDAILLKPILKQDLAKAMLKVFKR